MSNWYSKSDGDGDGDGDDHCYVPQTMDDDENSWIDRGKYVGYVL